MWFILLKILKLGYTENKKRKAKKQQQQQQYHQHPYGGTGNGNGYPYTTFQTVPHGDTNNMNMGTNMEMNMDAGYPLPPQTQTQTRGTRASKRAGVKSLLWKIIHVIQFAFGLAVIGLYSQDINSARDKGDPAPAKWVYAVTTAFLGTATALVYLVLGWWLGRKKRGGREKRLHLPVFVWEGVLVVLWLVVFGIFGEMYIGVYYVGGQDVGDGERKVTRMRRAVWVDLVNLGVWGVSAVWRGLRWWRKRGQDGRRGEGVVEEKEMV